MGFWGFGVSGGLSGGLSGGFEVPDIPDANITVESVPEVQSAPDIPPIDIEGKDLNLHNQAFECKF